MKKEKATRTNDLIKPIILKHPKKNKGVIIGSYSDINGKDAIPLKDIEPTKAEIYAIIKHHINLLLSIDITFAMGQSGSWEIRQMPYSNQRIEYYSQFVDESEIQEMFNDVYKEVNLEQIEKDYREQTEKECS